MDSAYADQDGSYGKSTPEDGSYETSMALMHEEQLQVYEEYINETSEPIYEAASFDEFWAGQEKVGMAEEDSNW